MYNSKHSTFTIGEDERCPCYTDIMNAEHRCRTTNSMMLDDRGVAINYTIEGQVLWPLGGLGKDVVFFVQATDTST